MADVATTVVVEAPRGANDDNHRRYQATVPAANAGDTLTIQLPAEAYSAIGPYHGFSITNAFIEEFLLASLPGARAKTMIPVASWSYNEATGVVRVTLGSTAVLAGGVTYTARVILDYVVTR